MPLTLGSELSGIVEEIGAEVSGFKLGDGVYGATNEQFSGVDIMRAIFHTLDVKSLIITTAEGKQRIDEACASAHCSIQTRVVGDDARIAPEKIVELLYREFGVRLLLHEGGPALFGQFLQEHLIDELFLTLAPQIAGRGSTIDRPALVPNVAFAPEEAPWLQLLSVKHRGDHLYLRYRKAAGLD